MIESSPLIIASRLHMQYAAGTSCVDALKDVDLEIASGERVAVTGPSGCGKSTLLLLLAGLERPTSGSIHIDGMALSEMDSNALADLRSERVGIVFQSFHLVSSLTALDNVALPLEIAGTRSAKSRAEEMLEIVGLGTRGWHYPSQLSGGEQQRVAIARALVHRPAIILADEPTGNLDDKTGASVGKVLFDLVADTGATLVLVTHDLEFAGSCDRVLRLHDGALAEQTRGSGKSHAAVYR
ncbi:MAG: ABC transporter ATP-binding protein [Gammaproteobacteria bacterium]|nr:ABC transporter ATP-binding protein [Gammaproteobacteria bacterium]